MKTKEELNALKEEVETLNQKLAELTDEELAQVSGGATATYIVKPGDTLSSIAQHLGVKMSDLKDMNNIKNPDLIEVGWTLRYPC